MTFILEMNKSLIETLSQRVSQSLTSVKGKVKKTSGTDQNLQLRMALVFSFLHGQLQISNEFVFRSSHSLVVENL